MILLFMLGSCSPFVLGGKYITPVNPSSSAVMPYVVASGLNVRIKNTDKTLRFDYLEDHPIYISAKRLPFQNKSLHDI